MGKRIESLTPHLEQFIAEQKMFFVGTAMSEGHINISPKGLDTLRVLSSNRVIWLNLTGSGNETAAHILESNRITLMFCAFEGKPLILRLYGTAKVYHERDAMFTELISHFPDLEGSRQIFDVQIDLVQTSCGFGVPLMDYNGERTILKDWADKKGDAGIKAYWKEKNTVSLDGKETGIF